MAKGTIAQRPNFDWGRLIAAKDQEINRLEGIHDGLLSVRYSRDKRGWATFLDDRTIEVAGKCFTAQTFPHRLRWADQPA